MSGVTQQALLGRGGSAATWQTVATNASFSTDDAGWSGYTIRQFIPQASLLVTGGTQVRVTVNAGASNGFSADFAYIGQASASYSATSPAFASTPTQLLFNSGFAALALAAGQSIVSDAVSFVMPSSNGLIISMHFSATSSMRTSPANTPTNWNLSFKNASDASTVSAVSYVNYTATKGGAMFALVEEFA